MPTETRLFRGILRKRNCWMSAGFLTECMAQNNAVREVGGAEFVPLHPTDAEMKVSSAENPEDYYSFSILSLKWIRVECARVYVCFCTFRMLTEALLV